MMKWYRAVGVLTVLAFAPGVATANDGQIYVSLGGLYVLPYDSETSYSEGDTTLSGTIPLDNGPGFTAAIGYGASNGLRAEIEFGYRSSTWSSFEDLRFTQDGNEEDVAGLEINAIKGEMKTLSLMANAIMAFGTSWGMKPYIGAGVGFAQHDLSTDEFVFSYYGEHFKEEGDTVDDTVVAYQAMLGVTYPMSEKSEVRLGYRYFATDEADFDGGETDYGSHNVEVGVLFRF